MDGVCFRFVKEMLATAAFSLEVFETGRLGKNSGSAGALLCTCGTFVGTCWFYETLGGTIVAEEPVTSPP